uniref:Uncharacterized protein n=1 Tax=Arundo donax TaxID=35708 RepID=A0A0A8YTV3_ARUDO
MSSVLLSTTTFPHRPRITTCA